MKFEPEILQTIDKLASLESILEFSSLWSGVAGSGLISALCRYSAVLLFAMLIIAILAKFFRHGIEFNAQENIALIVKALFIGTLFCIPTVYVNWISLLAGLSTKMNTTVGADALFKFQVQLRAFIYGLQASGTGAASIANAPILDITVSVLNNLVIMTYFALISIGPTFLILSFAFGPICAALSMVFPGVMSVWSRLVIASMFFSMIVAVALYAFSMSSIFDLAAQFTFIGTNLVALALLLALLFYFLMIPVAIAAVFKIGAFAYIGLLFSFPLLLLGQIPSLLKIYASVKTVTGNIKRFGKLVIRR
jgi:hypothetical protein